MKDSLGTITDITDSLGNLVQHFVYSPFGEIIKVTNKLNEDISSDWNIRTSYTFTNREYDEESGLYYYRARYYDASTGRFLQVDPDPGKLAIPSTHVNKYIYVLNNPIRHTDPSGKILPILVGIGIAALVGGIANGLTNKNGKSFWVNFLQGAAVGAIGASLVVGAGFGGAYIGAYLGGTAFSATIGGAFGGAIAGGATSYAGQRILNPSKKVSWAGVFIGAFGGALTGGIIGAHVGTSASLVNDANRAVTTSIDYSRPDAAVGHQDWDDDWHMLDFYVDQPGNSLVNELLNGLY